MNREDLELYVSGNFDGDVAALERAIAENPAMAERVADEARFEMLLRDAAAAAVFCVGCEELVRGERCDACGAATRPGGYVVERVLVSNAHGRMYVARDADGKQVALKELAFVQAPSARTIDAFEREAKFLRALEHPAIPRFVASFEEGRGVHARYYLAQELVDGTSLDRLDEHWYTEPEIIDIARQVLAIIVYLQSLSPMVIHRDIKPANMVRRADGSIALVDFGAAYVQGATAGLTTVGTFGYMPVEQLAGIVDATTDCYALGASLLYLLTRQEPWRLQQTKTTINASAPLRAFLDKLVANDPRERFASAKDALVALENRDALVRKPQARGDRDPQQSWVRPVRIAAFTMAALAVGGLGVYKLATRDAKKQSNITVEPVSQIATLRLAMPDGVRAELYIDDTKIQAVQNNVAVPVMAGQHKVKLVGANGARCESEMSLPAGKITTVECIMPPVQVTPDAMPAPPPPPRLEVTTPVDLAFTGVAFKSIAGVIAAQCKVNLVVPGHLDFKVSMTFKDAPCNQAFETLLQAHELDYVYRPDSKLVRVARRVDIERERAMPTRSQARLPAGERIDLVSTKDTLRPMLGKIVGDSMNLLVPEHIDGKVSVYAKDVPSNELFEVILESLELGYRYREAGKLIRVARRVDLEREAQSDPDSPMR